MTEYLSDITQQHAHDHATAGTFLCQFSNSWPTATFRGVGRPCDDWQSCSLEAPRRRSCCPASRRYRLAGRLGEHKCLFAAIALLRQRLLWCGVELRFTIIETRVEGLGHIDVGAIRLTFLHRVLQLLRHLHIPGESVGARLIGTWELQPDIDRLAFAHGSGDNLGRVGLLS